MTDFSYALAFRQLRASDALTLPTQLDAPDTDDLGELQAVLAKAYRTDASSWPGTAPSFDGEVGLWAIRVFLNVAHRWHAGTETAALVGGPPLPPATPDAAAAYHLSADVALRYLPPLLQRVTADSPDDVLLAETDTLRAAFPFTFLLSPKPVWPTDQIALANVTYRGAVIDRVITRDRLEVARHPDLLPHVETALGAHAETLWPRFHRMRGGEVG